MTPGFDLSQLPPRPDLSQEIALWEQGLVYIAGIDEAGRGALAGPVCAAALILPVDTGLMQALAGVNDSKRIPPVERAAWAERLRSVALTWGVGFASHEEIDSLGIVTATRLAMSRAVDGLSVPPQHLLVDYMNLPEIPIAQTSLVKGDARSLSIAGASILAKTARDLLLQEMDTLYPGYEFARHKGYGTQAHRAALRKRGPCAIHRRSFQPLRELTQEYNIQELRSYSEKDLRL